MPSNFIVFAVPGLANDRDRAFKVSPGKIVFA